VSKETQEIITRIDEFISDESVADGFDSNLSI